MAVGDFNRDGVQDLAVADYGVYPQRGTTVSVLVGNGDGSFRAPQAFQSGSAPTCVAVGDVNRDGIQDLASCNYNDNNVAILLGNGDATFRPAGTLAVGVAPWFVLFDDLNGDQLPDLAVTGHWSDIVSTAMGNGDGTFQPHRWFFTDRGPTGLALADLNGDGRRDLVTANYFSTTVSVLLGNGDGTLQAAQHFAADLAPMGVAAGDFNGDGQPDVATGNYFASSVSVLMNRTSTPRVSPPTFNPPAGTYLATMTVALATSTTGATIRFTTDGSTPTASSPVYTSPIPVTQTTTISAMASASGMADSAVASAVYTILLPVATPTFSPPAGTYAGSATVTISVTTSGATIRYTTDGSTPTATSPAYTGPISVTQTRTIRAFATASGRADSDVASATYTIQVVTPTFSVPAGTYNQPQTVTVTHHDRRRGDLLHDRRDPADDGVHAIHRPDRGAADDDRQSNGRGDRNGGQRRRERHVHPPGGHADLQPGRRLVPPAAVRHHLGRQPEHDDLLHDRREHSDDFLHSVHRQRDFRGLGNDHDQSDSGCARLVAERRGECDLPDWVVRPPLPFFSTGIRHD